MRIIKTPVRTPSQNVGSPARRECLDRALIAREWHLRLALDVYAAHYNSHRDGESDGLLGRLFPASCAGTGGARSGTQNACPLCGQLITDRRLTDYGLRVLRSNSPLWTPPMNASHSPGVKFSTAPRGFLLSRTRIVSSVRPATSTQLALYPLSELFFHVREESPSDRRRPRSAKSRIKLHLRRSSCSYFKFHTRRQFGHGGSDIDACRILPTMPDQTYAITTRRRALLTK